MKYPEGSIENFLGYNQTEANMSKRWKKDKVRCEVCKKDVPKLNTVLHDKGKELVHVCQHHIKV